MVQEGDGKLEAQIEALLNVEKQMRQAGDVAGTRKAVSEILQLCFEARAWKTINDQIVLLSKRRGQLKQAVQAMVRQAMEYIDQTPDLETKIELIKTLNSVSAGKIYVEMERARLIKKLAKIKEEQGLIAEAADLMQEIAVETFGAMAKTEKIAFILEQVSDLFPYLIAWDLFCIETLYKNICKYIYFLFTGASMFRPPRLRTGTNSLTKDQS
nr:26S proteasome non-ATPase regulatory subunit 12 homolog A-like [Ipomoea batatas]